jgi:hypothetical protein
MRDMVLSYEGRNDFWASHPPNVMRGMGYLGEECPYDRNLIDMFRLQEQLNDGYAYYNTFVSTAWLDEHHAIDDDPEVAQSLYRRQLEYLGSLARENAVEALTASQFGERFRDEHPIGEPEVFLAKELLYGSGKHYFWYLDAHSRVLLDATQGGSIGDLRPYVGGVEVATGPESPSLCYGSYPYLIHSQHRSGYPNHSEDGSRSTLLVSEAGFQVDLATLPTRVRKVSRTRSSMGRITVVELEAVTAELPSGDCRIRTTVTFEELGGTRVDRSIDLDDSLRELDVVERFKLAPGITEYPWDLRGVELFVAGAGDDRLEYGYNGRTVTCACRNAGSAADLGERSGAGATFPDLSTEVLLSPEDDAEWVATAGEGHLFSPYVTLLLSRTITQSEETSVCLYLQRT